MRWTNDDGGSPVMEGGERGSGTVLAIAIMATVIAAATAVLPAAHALSVRQRIAGAADSAALAAADVVSGVVAGEPCATASVIARENGAVLTACRADELVVTVSAEAVVWGLTLRASARAGPRGSGWN